MTQSRTLIFERALKAPRANIWRCWSEPDLLKLWFCPKPWRVSKARMELRPGGRFDTVMNGPAGEEVDNRGVFLDVVAGERLVFTDAFVSAWEPSEKPFMTVTVTLADAPGGTRYLARVVHWSEEDRKAHEAMGFEEGWGAAADQLEALAVTL